MYCIYVFLSKIEINKNVLTFTNLYQKLWIFHAEKLLVSKLYFHNILKYIYFIFVAALKNLFGLQLAYYKIIRAELGQ